MTSDAPTAELTAVLTGPPEHEPGRSSRGSRLRRWLLPRRSGLLRRLAYAVLGVPLAAAYAGLYAALVASSVLLVYGVGLVLVPLVLATVRACGGWERRLAGRLVRVEVPPGPAIRRERGRVRRLRLLVTSGSTWRALGWLGARVLAGATVAAALLLGGSGAAVLVAYSDAFDLPRHVLLDLVLLPAAALVVLLTVRLLEVSTNVLAAVAPTLLGAGPDERVAAMRRASTRIAGRTTVARDLHDTIGHALTASLLQSEAAQRALRSVDGDPTRAADLEFARQALDHVAGNTRQALVELDRALAALSDPATAREGEPTSDLRDLDGLVAGLRDGGLPIQARVSLDVDQVAPEVSRVAYRVVQEGLTNVLRHAGLVATTVDVGVAGSRLVVCVSNAPAARRRVLPGRNGGHGLSGLRERTAELGGTLLAGPRDDDGYSLEASWPGGWRRG